MTNPTGVKFWWDEDVQAYRMVSPYRRDFLDLMKQLVPASDRAWTADSHTWTVTERFLEPVKQLAEKIFQCKATVVTKDQTKKATTPPALAKATIDVTIVKFFKLLPYEAAQKAYREAAMRLHPDRNPNSTMDAMTDLNACWQKLEKELFNR
jgi:hypothetical protein